MQSTFIAWVNASENPFSPKKFPSLLVFLSNFKNPKLLYPLGDIVRDIMKICTDNILFEMHQNTPRVIQLFIDRHNHIIMGKSTQTNYTRWNFQKHLPIVKLSIILHKGWGCSSDLLPLFMKAMCYSPKKE